MSPKPNPDVRSLGILAGLSTAAATLYLLDLPSMAVILGGCGITAYITTWLASRA